MEKKTEKKSVIVKLPWNGQEIDISPALPFDMGDWRKLKKRGVVFRDFLSGGDAETMLELSFFVLNKVKANSVKMEQLESLTFVANTSFFTSIQSGISNAETPDAVEEEKAAIEADPTIPTSSGLPSIGVGQEVKPNDMATENSTDL